MYNSANVTVANSVIDSNTTNGIYCHFGGNATIEGNTITNSAVGVYCLDSSHPSIRSENVIEDNTTGIKCDDECDPLIRDNKIADNANGILSVYDSEPNLGVSCNDTTCVDTCSTSGGNKIENNSSHHVANLSAGVTLSAECNYWGSTGPKASKFSGSVDYSPHLSADPLQNLLPPRDQGDGDEGEDDTAESRLPSRYEMSPNYPNPFNPTTVVRYEVPPPGDVVRISIYNVRGQLVATLVDERVSPGYYGATWNGTSASGEMVATGVYFIQMTARGFVQTRKLVLIK